VRPAPGNFSKVKRGTFTHVVDGRLEEAGVDLVMSFGISSSV
jgi:hypothetical protein